MQSHYSSELDITIKGLQDAEKGLRKLMNAYRYLKEMIFESKEIDAKQDQLIIELSNDCKKVMDDDFNAPKLVATLYEIASIINIYYNDGKKITNISKETYDTLLHCFNGYLFDVLGLQDEKDNDNIEVLDKVMKLVIDIRKQSRENKDWSTSDKIRDGLKDADIQFNDGKEGSTWSIN
jgi:cysteinyl-tRNA synthetase